MTSWVYLLALTAPLGAILIFMPVVRSFCFKSLLLDWPGGRKQHPTPIPRLGGVAVFLSFTGTVLIGFAFAPWLASFPGLHELFPHVMTALAEAWRVKTLLLGLLVGGTIMFAVGLADDVLGERLNTRWKFAGQCAAAGIVVACGIRVEFLGFEPLNIVVSFLWILGISNAFNLLDNMDGLAAGVAAVCSIIFLVNAAELGEIFICLVLTALIGSLLGFLRFNFYPASVFMGDCGALFIGFILSSLTILEHYVSPASSSLFPVLMPPLVLAVPLMDTMSVIYIRIREGRPVYVGDRCHLSHRLVQCGLTEPQTVIFLFLVTFGLGLGALHLADTSPSRSLWIVVDSALMAALVLWGIRFGVNLRAAQANVKAPIQSSKNSAEGFMKSTPTKTLLLGLLLMAWPAASGFAAEDPGVKLIDMFAKAEGDVYRIYIMASGDISEYKTSREIRSDSYKLTLDLPALPPTDTKYDLTTPFSRRFEVWPMKLGDQIYSRVSMELDLEASSVIGQTGPSRIFITISRKSETEVAGALGGPAEKLPIAIAPMPADQPSPPSDPLPAQNESEPEIPSPEEPQLDVEPIPMETGPEPDFSEETVDSEPEEQTTVEPTADSADTTLFMTDQTNPEFFSLFPIPTTEPRIATNLNIDEPVGIHFDGIRLGRFLMRPAVFAGYMKGSNVLLLSDDQFRDSVIQFRARTTFDLLQSENALRLAYEFRYQEYGQFELIDNFSHFFDFNTNIHVTPTMLVEIQNHLVKGSYESREFDPGGEVAFSFDPFVRNLTRAALNKDMSERLGWEIYGSYNHVHFLERANFFFDYNTAISGASVLYHLSPLTSLFGSYEYMRTPQPTARPEAESSGNSFYMGLKGEITPLLVGQMRAGFRDQEFGIQDNRLSYRGLVADLSLTRYFGELTALEVRGGRITSPSNFEQNGYFLSNFLHLRFAVPITHNFRLNTGASLFDNNYPLPSAKIGAPRSDLATTGWLGAAYHFNRRTYFEVNYRYERRNSNLDEYSYRNNVIMFLVGFGYL